MRPNTLKIPVTKTAILIGNKGIFLKPISIPVVFVIPNDRKRIGFGKRTT
jgi:hypothetical protein